MPIDIEKLSLDELIDLNRRVVRRIQYLASLKTRAELDRFEVGDRVSFQSDPSTLAQGRPERSEAQSKDDGRAVEGIVVRVNRKTLSVRTRDTHWNIHPKFLTRVQTADPALPQDVQNLIDGLKE